MDYKKMNDEALEMELLSGNLNTFDEIYRRYYKKMLDIALAIIRDRNTAKDVVQDVFIRFYARISDNKIPVSNAHLFIEKFLSQSTRNACKDVFRFKKRINFVGFENNEQFESMLFSLGNDLYSMNKIEMNVENEFNREVARAVLKLPQEQQTVIRLRFESGLTFLEISELEGESINTWLGRMRYALKNLRKILDIHVKESEE